MSSKKSYFILFSVLIVIISVISSVILFYYKGLPFGSSVYDVLNKNETVYRYEKAQTILEKYPKMKYGSLPSSIREKFKTNLEGYFYAIPHNEVYQKICLNNRINNLLSKENQLSRYSFIKEQTIYVYINEALLRSYFKLLEKLQGRNHDPLGIVITSAYRSSIRNDRVGGAPQSQHLKGKAFDLRIGDVNKDGKINQDDKKIVYEILDREIIKDKGGLGFYPGTMIIHMDVRGKRARWNNYSR